ncbi:MAG: four-carbon acid sugar kinase family protein [Lautropia sp.]
MRAGAPVRLIADDLTGALDAAAPFSRRGGPIRVTWQPAPAPAGAGALDLGTRDLESAIAFERMSRSARSWFDGSEGLAFKKVDSVWRGHPAEEITAALDAGRFGCAIVAPALPEQGRITRRGQQAILEAGTPRIVADLVRDLAAAGLDAAPAERAGPQTRAIVCDAEDAGQLDAIVARFAGGTDRLLWCGSNGLAAALARHHPALAGASAPRPQSPPPALGPGRAAGPIIVLVGSDHAISSRQAARLALAPGVVSRRLDVAAGRLDGVWPAGDRIVLLTLSVPAGMSRIAAGEHARQAFGATIARLPKPGAAIVAGGHTLRSLGEALGATGLAVQGELRPGIPVSAWSDGAWAGTTLVSKSGSFGDTCELVRLAGHLDRLRDNPAARSVREENA